MPVLSSTDRDPQIRRKARIFLLARERGQVQRQITYLRMCLADALIHLEQVEFSLEQVKAAYAAEDRARASLDGRLRVVKGKGARSAPVRQSKPKVPTALAKMMAENGITIEDLLAAVAKAEGK